MMKRLAFLFLITCGSLLSFAQVQLPNIFSDSMVLQRDRPIPIWGTAGRNEKITVQFNGQTKTTKAGKDGKWKLMLDAENAGGPYTLTVKGNNKTSIYKGLLTGDVWVASGQSNMEFSVSNVTNATAEIAAAHYPQIRHLYVPKAVAGTPQNDIAASHWQPANPANVGNFTAVGYFFARELYTQLQVPIGIIHTSWGGTDVETWISNEGLKNSETFGPMMANLPAIDLDAVAEQKKKSIAAMLEKLQGGLPKNSAVANFGKKDLDDKSWPLMQLPALWEAQLPGLDGEVWFRKTITISEADAGKPATLQLAMIDDADETFVNGTPVGSTNGYNLKRVYTVPAGVLRAGNNVIAVRVHDTGGGGGIYGDAGDMTISIDNHRQSIAGDWRFMVAGVAPGNTSVGPNSYTSLLYNAMIHPLVPFAIKGVIWYQGENNAGRAYQYRSAFPLLINDWRAQWKQGDFPFYFVQLASFNAGNGNSRQGSAWAELREAQAMTLSLPNTGMAVTTDVGESNDIHPKNKQDVGRRLAMIALHDTYAKDLVYQGPAYQSMQVEDNKVVLHFTNTGGGLMVQDRYGYLRGFEVAGEDRQFHYAKAYVEGDKVVVYADAVSKPVAVRYGWTDDAGEDNLYNKEGFPAAPFRTDDWKGITENNSYKIPL